MDDDSFDYVFYSYGLRLYGNMPLIEPQEWKEVKKWRIFAIVIDTSMSCSGDLVKKFLEETYGILSEAGAFFRESISTLYNVMTRCSRTGRLPVKKNYRNIWKSWILPGKVERISDRRLPILMS